MEDLKVRDDWQEWDDPRPMALDTCEIQRWYRLLLEVHHRLFELRTAARIVPGNVLRLRLSSLF